MLIMLYNNIRGGCEVISPISHLNSFKKILLMKYLTSSSTI